MAEETKKVPWIPGFQRPNFVFYRIKFSLPTKIPPNLIYAAIFIIVFYIYIGGVYNFVENPIAYGTKTNNNPLLIYPAQDRQFLIEGIVAGLVMFMGAFGLYFLGAATADPHNKNRAVTYQVIGILLIVMAFLIISSMYNCKINANNPCRQ